MLHTRKLIDLPPPVKYMEEHLREFSMGFELSQILFTAFELGLFDTLKEPMTSKTFLEKTGFSPDVTIRLLDILTSMNFLSKKEGKYYTNPDFVPFIVKGEPYYSRYLESASRDRKIWNGLKESILKGTSPLVDKTRFNYSPESIKWTALDCTHGRLQKTLSIVSSLPEFKHAKKLIDLGGGHGLFGIGLSQENPELNVVIFDRQEIAGIAIENIEMYKMHERVSFVPGDYMLEDFGEGYDIILEALSLEGGPEEAKVLYRKVSDALNPGGLYITQLFTLDDSDISPLPTLILDLREKITKNQQLHLMTNSDLFTLLHYVGLSGEQVIDMSMGDNLPLRMVIARKI